MARLVDITVDHLEKVHSYDRKTDFVPVDVLRERERAKHYEDPFVVSFDIHFAEFFDTLGENTSTKDIYLERFFGD